MSELTEKQRAKLPAKEFGLPEKARTSDAKKETGNYPMPDKGHAISAKFICVARDPRDVALSMDIYNTEYTQAEGRKNGVLEDNLRKDREIGDVQRENFRKAHAAGVKMLFGTDAGIYPHGENAKQFLKDNPDTLVEVETKVRDALQTKGVSGSSGSFEE